MGQWTFYQDEREDHRVGLGKYAGERKYVSGIGMDIEQFPYVEFINEKCDNINLVDLPKGLWCEYCCHYHAIFKMKGIEKTYQPLAERGAMLPPTTLNPVMMNVTKTLIPTLLIWKRLTSVLVRTFGNE